MSQQQHCAFSLWNQEQHIRGRWIHLHPQIHRSFNWWNKETEALQDSVMDLISKEWGSSTLSAPQPSTGSNPEFWCRVTADLKTAHCHCYCGERGRPEGNSRVSNWGVCSQLNPAETIATRAETRGRTGQDLQRQLPGAGVWRSSEWRRMWWWVLVQDQALPQQSSRLHSKASK